MELTILITPVNAGLISQSRNNLFPLITQNGNTIITQDGKAILVFSQYDEITLTQTENDKYTFVGWYINGTQVSTSDTYSIYLDQDKEIEARYTQNEFDIVVNSNISGTTIYQSATRVSVGESVEIRAREVAGYEFVRWSDGNLDNPRTITPTHDIDLQGIYQVVNLGDTYYQYRGYVKDQLSMTSKPKAFIVAISDTDKEDLLTKATTTINVKKMPSNINEGDVIVLYTARGTRYYQGVINKIEGLKIQCSQMASFFKAIFNKSFINTLTETYLENEIKAIAEHIQSGLYFGTTYTDSLIATRLGGFTIQSEPSQLVNLPTDKDKDGNDNNTQYDFEQFIYDIYEQYGVITEFQVNFEGTNYITFKTPTYSQITIANNQNAIIDLSPITKIEETNKLIIFNQDKTYRTTYIARKDGEIVEEPSLMANRFEITNTKIVYSDDSDETLVNANLPKQMYNHRLTFTMLVKNSIYDWQDFKLGVPLHIFINGSFFDTILTGREIIHEQNQDIQVIKYTCGIVRIKLTDLLNMRKVG